MAKHQGDACTEQQQAFRILANGLGNAFDCVHDRDSFAVAMSCLTWFMARVGTGARVRLERATKKAISAIEDGRGRDDQARRRAP